MKYKNLIVLVILLLAASCANSELSYDFPKAKKAYTGKTFVKKSFSKSINQVAISDSAPVSEKTEHGEDEEKWALPNTPFYLKVLKAGESTKVTNDKGEEVKFSVITEYASASKKYCKKYLVNDDINLACFNPHWKPVRIFE